MCGGNWWFGLIILSFSLYCDIIILMAQCVFSQEAARQTEISPHVYQGELPVIRPSPHYQSNIGQDLWNWWPFGAGRYCVYWSQTFLTCQRHAFVNSPHSKLSLTNRGKEAVFSGLGRAWGPVFAYYWYLWICQVVIFLESFLKSICPTKSF